MTQIVEVPVRELMPHPKNPRKKLGDLSELSASIKAQGVRQNLLVMPLEGSRFAKYKVVFGHRRLQAAKDAGLQTVPCVVDDTLTEVHALELMLVENLHRADLTILEEGDAYVELLDLGVKVTTLSKQTGRAPQTVKARVALAKSPEKLRHVIDQGTLALDDAQAIASISVDYPNVYKEHLADAKAGQWGWKLGQARQSVKRIKRLAELEKAGHRIVDGPDYRKGFRDRDRTSYSLRELGIGPKDHATCPGAIVMVEQWGGEQFACDQAPTYHPDEVKVAQAAETMVSTSATRDWEAEAQARREQEAARLAPYVAAQQARVAWLVGRLTAPSTDVDKVAGVLGTVLTTPYYVEADGGYTSSTSSILKALYVEALFEGKDFDPLGTCLVFLVLLVEADLESSSLESVHRDLLSDSLPSYREDSNYLHFCSAYLKALEAEGYPLSDIEVALISAIAAYTAPEAEVEESEPVVDVGEDGGSDV